MDEINVFEDLVNKLLWLGGWIIQHLAGILKLGTQASGISGFNSPLVFLSIGIFFIFGCLHIFKRFLRKD